MIEQETESLLIGGMNKMELQAIIGSYKGRIRDYNTSAICSYIDNLNRIDPATIWNAWDTNVSKVRDFHHPKSVVSANKVRNLYVIIPGIIDPQEFFRYLSKNGYVVRDSKLTQEAYKKTSIIPPIPPLDLDSSGLIGPYASHCQIGDTKVNPLEFEQK